MHHLQALCSHVDNVHIPVCGHCVQAVCNVHILLTPYTCCRRAETIFWKTQEESLLKNGGILILLPIVQIRSTQTLCTHVDTVHNLETPHIHLDTVHINLDRFTVRDFGISVNFGHVKCFMPVAVFLVLYLPLLVFLFNLVNLGIFRHFPGLAMRVHASSGINLGCCALWLCNPPLFLLFFFSDHLEFLDVLFQRICWDYV